MLPSKKITSPGIVVLLLAGVLLVMLLTACTITERSYSVWLAYEGQANYLAAVQADPQADKDALYQKYVTAVYTTTCRSRGLEGVGPGVSQELLASLKYPLGNQDVLAEEVRTLQQSNTERVVQETLQRAEKLLPGSNITVCIFALDPIQNSSIVFRMHGVTGMTNGPGVSLIFVANSNDWLDWLPYTIAHEYHHVVSSQDYSKPSSSPPNLLDVLLIEGRADSFAHILYPDKEAPWTMALTPQEEAAQWQLFQNELNSTTNLQRFIFGDNQIPTWAGYTIGYHIVQKYLKSHPNVSLKEWTKLDAQQLLNESGYTGQP